MIVKGNREKPDPKKGIKQAKTGRAIRPKFGIKVTGRTYSWNTKMDKVGIIREGLPYASIEVVSANANLPVSRMLHLFGVRQTTYNKKKKAEDLMSGRDSEIVLTLSELLQFGAQVFNDEKEKFQRWLKKPNISLGSVTPESLFDSVTGIQEVRNCLNRLEYGNFA